jgi:hypothetical protein
MFPVVPCGVSCELDDTIVIALSHVRHVFNFSEIAFQDPISKLRLISGMQISKIVLKFTSTNNKRLFGWCRAGSVCAAFQIGVYIAIERGIGLLTVSDIVMN